MRCFLLSLLLALPLRAAEVHVDNGSALRKALANAKPGSEIVLAPGTYKGGLHVKDLHGTEANPIIIRGGFGAEIRSRQIGRVKWTPAVRFQGGGRTGMQWSNCSHIVLQNFTVSGFAHNGINIDDGGSFDTPAHAFLLENLRVEKIGPTGNFDGIKLSGLKRSRITQCTITGWGGSGIDMVGCHEMTIAQNHLEGLPGHSQNSGIQMKGGSSRIRIHQNTFTDAGARAINMGGSTGLPYFRPQNATAEARDIDVAGNTFTGSEAPLAWVGSVNARVHHNTILYPKKWVGRILQESTQPRFEQVQNGTFTHNRIHYGPSIRTFFNVGPNTRPDTFTFAHNLWIKSPGARDPNTPTPESQRTVKERIASSDTTIHGATSWRP